MFVSCEDSERVDNLLGCVDVGGFSSHEVKEAVTLDISTCIGVDNGEDTLEVNFSLYVLTHTVTKRN